MRKWAYNKMIELGIPESVADFIHGRASRSVGAQHYLDKAKQAEQYVLNILACMDVDDLLRLPTADVHRVGELIIR